MSNDMMEVLNLILKKVEGIEKTLNINSKETTAKNVVGLHILRMMRNLIYSIC